AGLLSCLLAYATGRALSCWVGADHVDACPRLPGAVAALHAAAPNIAARIASLEEYETAVAQPRGTVVGEMIRGRYRPILRGVNSTRAWIKQENARCERLLLE